MKTIYEYIEDLDSFLKSNVNLYMRTHVLNMKENLTCIADLTKQDESDREEIKHLRDKYLPDLNELLSDHLHLDRERQTGIFKTKKEDIERLVREADEYLEILNDKIDGDIKVEIAIKPYAKPLVDTDEEKDMQLVDKVDSSQIDEKDVETKEEKDIQFVNKSETSQKVVEKTDFSIDKERVNGFDYSLFSKTVVFIFIVIAGFLIICCIEQYRENQRILMEQKEYEQELESTETIDWEAYYEEQYSNGVIAYNFKNYSKAKYYFKEAHHIKYSDAFLDNIENLETFEDYYVDNVYPCYARYVYKELRYSEVYLPSGYKDKVNKIADVCDLYKQIIDYDWYLDKNPASQYKDSGIKSLDQYIQIDVYGNAYFVWKRGKVESGKLCEYTVVYSGTGNVKDNQFELKIIYDNKNKNNVGKTFWVKIEKIKVDYEYYSDTAHKYVTEKVEEYKMSVVNDQDKKYFETVYDHLENRRFEENFELSSYPWPSDSKVIIHESNNYHPSTSSNNNKDYDGEWKDFDDFYDDTYGDYADEAEAYEEWDSMYN